MKFLINPNKFIKFADLLIKPIFYLSLLVLILGLIFALYLSPNDYQQGSTVRIMYVHVPSAWFALLTFFIMTIYSIIGLAFKIPMAFIVNTAIAPIGAIFTLICIITGSLWGKPMWGTWWVWDARLTSVAVLLVIYLIIIFINYSFENIRVKEKISAIFILVGSINLPIIKFSVDWWNTLHQPASILRTGGISINSEMLVPLFLMAIGFLLLFIYTLLVSVEINIKEKRIVVFKYNANKN